MNILTYETASLARLPPVGELFGDMKTVVGFILTSATSIPSTWAHT